MHTPLVALIYAKGCGHCDVAKPEFEKLTNRFPPDFRFGLLDIDKPGLNLDFPVEGTPTLYFAYKGRRFSTNPEILRHNFDAAWMEKWLRAAMAKADAS